MSATIVSKRGLLRANRMTLLPRAATARGGLADPTRRSRNHRKRAIKFHRIFRSVTL
jgi:hypothetical protein